MTDLIERAEAWLKAYAPAATRFEDEAAAIINGLLAVVKRLPRFADGPLAVPGDTGYLQPSITYDDAEDDKPASQWYMHDDYECEALTLSVGSMHGYEDYAYASELYSTPDAARAGAMAQEELWRADDAEQARPTQGEGRE